MNNELATTLRLAIIDSPNEVVALSEVAGLACRAVTAAKDQCQLAEWETQDQKDQVLALTGYLERALQQINVAANLLNLNMADPAWTLLNGAAHCIEAMLAVDDHTDLPTLDCNEQLHSITQDAADAIFNLQYLTPVHSCLTLATIQATAATRLARTPEVFLDENKLDRLFITTAWETMGIARDHLTQFLDSWWGVETISEITAALEHARTVSDTIFPAAA